MKKLYFIALLSSLALFSNAQQLVSAPVGTVDTFVQSDPRTLALAGGRDYTFTNSSWPDFESPCYFFGFNDTLFDVINGYNTQPPNGTCSGMKDVVYYPAWSDLNAGKIVYVGTTTFRYMNSSYVYVTNPNIPVRITIDFGEPVYYYDGVLVIPADADFGYNVLYECYSPSGAAYISGGPNTWTPSIRLFDILHTSTTSSICTSFDPGNFYTFTVVDDVWADKMVPYETGETVYMYTMDKANHSYEWTGPLGFSSTQPLDTLFNATEFMSGDYIVKITDEHNCPGFDTLSITVLTCNTFDTVDMILCDTYTSPSGKVLNTFGTHYDTIANTEGCDSLITIYLNPDDMKPVAQANDVTIYLDASGNASVNWMDVDNNSYDNCALSSLSIGKLNYSCNDLGVNYDGLIVQDASGNKDTTVFQVTVVDDIDPDPSAKDLTIYLDQNGLASITAIQANNSSSDNCAVTNVSVDKTSFDCDDLGANTVLFTAEDASGNDASVNFTVTVVDTIKPTISSPPADLTYGFCDSVVTYTISGIDDNCSDYTLSLVSGIASGQAFPVGTTTNTWSIKDGSNNEILVNFDVTILPKYFPKTFNDLAFCELDPAVDLSEGNSDLSFSGNGVGNDDKTFTPQTAGSGTHVISLEFADSMGCTATSNFDVVISSLPEPIIQRVASDQLQVTGEYESYLWFKDGSPMWDKTERLLRVNAVGLYSVRVTSAANCLGYSKTYGFGVTGIDDLKLYSDLRVYPNPVESMIYINFGDELKGVKEVEVLDILGNSVLNEQSTESLAYFDLGYLASGTYYVKITHENKFHIVRFIKK